MVHKYFNLLSSLGTIIVALSLVLIIVQIVKTPSVSAKNPSTVPPELCTGCQLDQSVFHDNRLVGKDFSLAVLQGSTFTGNDLSGVNFTSAILKGVDFNSTNITNVNFTNADMTSAQNVDTATRSGVVWSNTICPDGTNSNDDGNSCEGHLTPLP
jgi:uncharacterized protein YjbI with pentapeptide repeats